MSKRSCSASRSRATSSTYRQKRESIFAQLTPENSVHRPIDLESSDEEETDVEDMCVEDLAPRRIDF